ncbi:MAG: protein translocase subunit SecD [Chloroflexota bacterium]
MRRQLRGLILLGVLFAVSSAIVAIPHVEFTVPGLGWEVSRGQEDTFLGLSLGLDLTGGSHLVYRAIPEGGGDPTEDDMEVVRTTIANRVNEFGLSEPNIQLLGNPPDRVLVQLPGLEGARITVRFRGNTVTPEELQEFLSSPDIGHPEATVERGENNALIASVENLESAERDEEGNVITPAEADVIREAIAREFPVTALVTFAQPEQPEEQAPEDGEEQQQPEQEQAPEPAVTQEEIESLLDELGLSNATVESLSGDNWRIEMTGIDQPEDETTPPAVEELRQELQNLADVSNFGVVGTIAEYTVGGGVQEAKHLIGQTAQLEFRERICGDLQNPPEGMSQEQWQQVRCTDPEYYSEEELDLSGQHLTDAYAGTQAGETGPVVNIEFNDEGADQFFEVTQRISRPTNRNVLAVYLDGEELVAPSAREGISGGRAFISGNFTAERARTIAIQLRSGVLPVDLELIQERNVDATLGTESLRRSVIAGAVGLALVLAFMSIYYKAPGIVASVALILYAVLLLAVFKAIPVTLTLSGLAALILSLGFAVDANILIAERTKEELRMGRALLASITSGFDRAWPSIRDGNVSTLIICIVLFWFGDRLGTSLIQGFALTLAIGIVVSMFTAFFASRLIMRTVANTWLGRRLTMFVPTGDVGTDHAMGTAE